MDQRLRRWTPRLLLLSVLAVLLSVGVLQHQWFSRSAAVEIEGALRGLESAVRQSVFREFQRYAPVVAAAREFQSRGVSSEAGYRGFAESLWSTYGPGGTAPSLLSAVGVWRPGGAARVWRGTGWQSEAEAPWMDDAVRQPSPLWLAPAPEAESVLLIRPLRDAPVIALFFSLDAFFDLYVRPAVSETVPGAAFVWKRPRPDPGRERPNFDTAGYVFNPITALWGRGSVSPVLTVSVPRMLGSPGSEFRLPSAAAIAITLPPEAPVLGIERRLAWNWLGALVLLAVVGAAFALALGQWSRLAELRRREREFVASVSHELRTPLTAIRSAADNFTRGIVPAERQTRYGRLILDQSVRLGRMIEEMLTFAQTEAAPAPVHDAVDFARWLERLRPPLDAVAAERGVALVWETEEIAGHTDAEALRMILENLVVNAVNHAYPGQPGAVRVHVRRRPGRIEISVEDDGRGIAPQEAKKVFEPFYRDQVSRANQEKGSGLGLFLALRQAKRLGGSLKLESPWRRGGTKHPGCRFVLEVPWHGEADDGR